MIGRLAQVVSALALVRFVVAQGDDYAYASILSAIFVVARMLGRPLLNRLIDRTGRRRAVLTADTLSA